MMKYRDKYPDMIPISCCMPDNIMRGFSPKPCIMCGEPTEYIEVNYEAHFCSEECVAEADRFVEAWNSIPLEYGTNDFEELAERGAFDDRLPK